MSANLEKRVELFETGVQGGLILFWLLFFGQAPVDSSRICYLVFGLMGLLSFALNFLHRPRRDLAMQTGWIWGASTLAGFMVLLANYRMLEGLSIGSRFVCRLLLFAGSFFLVRNLLRALLDRPMAFLWQRGQDKGRPGLSFGLSFALLAAWYLVFLFFCAYPGEVCSDSMNQIQQVLQGNYSNHHPFYHTMLIRLVLSLGMRLFGNLNAAVALFHALQALFLAACFAYVLATLRRMRLASWILTGIFLWYMFMPFHLMNSFTMWKDSIFAGVVTLFTVSLYRTLHRSMRRGGDLVLLFLSGLGFCLFRTNGLYAFALVALVFAVTFRRRERKLPWLFALVFVLALVLRYPVLKALAVPQPDAIESYSIPAQQIARVVAETGDLTAEERALLEEIVEVDRIGEQYHAQISDYIKNLVRETNRQDYLSSHKLQYLGLWLSLFCRHPSLYINAWVDQTCGYWNCRNGYWLVWWDGVTEEAGLHRQVRSEALDNLLHRYLDAFSSNEVLSIFSNVGFHVWILSLLFVLAAAKNRKDMIFALPVLAVILTLLIATPMCHEFRYAYSVFTSFPFIAAALLGCLKKHDI